MMKPVSRAIVVSCLFFLLGSTHHSQAQESAVSTINSKHDFLSENSSLLAERDELFNQGDEYYWNNEFEAALEYFRQAISGDFQDLPADEVKATALNLIGAIHAQWEEYEQAFNYCEQALVVAQEINSTGQALFALVVLGQSSLFSGQLERASDFYTRALALAREKGEPFDVGETLIGMASAYTIVGEYKEAIELYTDAIDILQNSDDVTLSIGAAHQNLAVTYMRLGMYPEALAHYRKAEEAFFEEGDSESRANALSGIGGIYEELDSEREIPAIFDELGGSDYTNYWKAITFYRQGLEILGAKSTRTKASILNNLAKVLDRFGWEQGESTFQEALDLYQQAEKIISEKDRPLLFAQITSNAGLAYLHRGIVEDSTEFLGEAEKRLHVAAHIQREFQDDPNTWMTLSRIGWCYERQGNVSEAIRMYNEALEIFEKILELTNTREISTMFAQQATKTYQRLILLLAQEKCYEDAFLTTERARARTFLDQIANRRINSEEITEQELFAKKRKLQQELAAIERRLQHQRLQPKIQRDDILVTQLKSDLEKTRAEYKNFLLQFSVRQRLMNRVEPVTVKELQSRMDSETTLLSYFVTPQATLAFILTHNSLVALELPISEQDLKAEVDVLLQCSQSVDESGLQAYSTLYQWLIAPVEEHLKTGIVGIIPHGILHSVPFAALTDGQRYFSDDYITYSLPSANVLLFLLDNSQPVTYRAFTLVHARSRDFPTLYYANAESWVIRRLLSADVVVGAEVSEPAIKAALQHQYSIVHFAAHAQIDSADSLFSHIAVSSQEEADSNGKLDVHEIYQLDFSQTDLVVLSACDTRAGWQSSGDDVISLNRAFLYAGASSVLASLWPVDDEATMFLMNMFYLQLYQGIPKVEALRIAQQITRKRYPHPAYWAGFVLTGAPGFPVSVNAAQ